MAASGEHHRLRPRQRGEGVVGETHGVDEHAALAVDTAWELETEPPMLLLWMRQW